MSGLSLRARPLHVGVAIGEQALVAWCPGALDSPFTCALDPRGGPGEIWPDLADALESLRQSCEDSRAASSRDASRGPREAVLHVALLPPLAHARRAELPGLRTEEARQVCRREPSRYLPISADTPPLELEVEGHGWRGRSPFSLVAAHAALVEGIGAAARGARWRVSEIVPAEAAWAAAAASLLPRVARGSGIVVVALPDRIEIVGARRGTLAWLRRVPAQAPDVVSIVTAILDEFSDWLATVIGTTMLADELRERLPLARTPSAGTRVPPDDDPATLAACFAREASSPVLLPAEERLHEQRSIARHNAMRFTASLAMLLATGAVWWWSTARDLRSLAAARAQLRPTVSRALAVRDSVARASDHLLTLRRASADSPRWSALITTLASVLPDDAYLTSVRVDSDSLRLEGSAAHASAVFDAMARTPALGAVHPDGPIRQEISADGAIRERFALSAPLRRSP